MSLDVFHPAVAAWFRGAFAAPTDAQRLAWPALRAGQHALVAAPTGSGKTLAAFLTAIDALVREGQRGPLPDATRVLYVSPLKALSNDIARNLQAPLAGIRRRLREMDEEDVEVRTWVRTGDTTQAERAQMRRRAPHIVITTPESLYILLCSESGRRMLSSVGTVIVDEIHALAGNKRGAHLALSLERLEALAGKPPVRIGLSATQKPIEETAHFLIGARRPLEDCLIVDAGHVRRRDLAIEVPPSPLETVMSGEVWQQVYDRIAALIGGHRTTVVFVNTRRLAERVTRHLVERLGTDQVAAHHGSLSKAHRLDAEQRLKSGRLRAIVATASLELGIDIGEVDLVCQIGSCRSIAVFLQRAGRSGHAVGGVPRARLFPLSRDELIEAAALLDAVRRGELDRLHVAAQPLDVLAQQVVAEVAMRECGEEELYELYRSAYPYRDLSRETYGAVVRMLAQGFHTGRGQLRQHIHRDAVHGRLRARRGARLVAVTSGGAIPDNADYDVVLSPTDTIVGSLNEDFAIESLAGDVFQLGNAAYRILRVESGRVRVEDAQGQTPNVPFWLGEAPGRTDELSEAVSRLRAEVAERLDRGSALDWLTREVGVDAPAAMQIVDYLLAAARSLGVLPTQQTIVMERFFDETGGMQLVIHSPYGSRINRAWGLALRKRFCRKFDFELQAAATDDSIVLSLSTSHSFALEEVAHYLSASSVEAVLVQAVLAAPMFTSRWRWNAAIALAIPRMRSGKKMPARLQRIYAEDLIADVFPDQIACAENLSGEREIPDHPLVGQTLHDCLHEAMDLPGLQRLLARIGGGEVKIVAKDVTEPSPLALAVLNAQPYAFLDDAPLEERRTQAVAGRRWLDPGTAGDLGRLDEDAVERVRSEAFPSVESADELNDALLWFGCFSETEIGSRPALALLAGELAAAGRATRLRAGAVSLWIAAERLPQFAALLPNHSVEPAVTVPPEAAGRSWTREEALTEILRGRLEGSGPVLASDLVSLLGADPSDVESALARLEQEGFVLRGTFTPGATQIEWCERRLLARIHRYTVNRLRSEIEPVSPADFMRFLCHWQHVTPDERKEGPDALAGIVSQLEGFEAPAAAWETELLPARLVHYDMRWLDDLCLSGRAAWARWSNPPAGSDGSSGEPCEDPDSSAWDRSNGPGADPALRGRLTGRRAGPVRTTPVAFVPRRQLAFWNGLCPPAPPGEAAMSSRAARVLEHLAAQGASFFDELASGTRLLGAEVEAALAELVALGLVSSDSFAGLRALLLPSSGRSKSRHRARATGLDSAGRWGVVRRRAEASGDAAEYVARVLLRRYGVVFWRLLAREAPWLPPWRDLLRVYRRLEARGEIRGGRFVSGMTGEQFALPDAVATLRATRRRPPDGVLIGISGADPLNLVGFVIPGPRIPALTGNRLLLRDGVAVATLVAGAEQWLHPLEGASAATARKTLIVLPQV